MPLINAANTFVRDKPLKGGVKIIWEGNICYYTFIISVF